MVGIDREWQAADGSMIKAPLGKRGRGVLEATGSNPTDRGKAGCKRTLLSDIRGIPFSVVLCGANRHDSKMLMNALDAVIVAVPALQEQRHLLLDLEYDTFLMLLAGCVTFIRQLLSHCTLHTSGRIPARRSGLLARGNVFETASCDPAFRRPI